MTYFNNLGQARVGWRIPSGAVTPSTLSTSIYAVWNADTLGTSLDASIFRAYNGEAATVTSAQLSTNIFGVWNGETLGTSLDSNIFRVYNGDNVNDTSGNAQNGTNVGSVTFTTGKVGNAFTFNGSNYVSLPTNSLSSLTGDFSISCWVNLTSLTSVQCFLSNYIYTAGINDGYIGFRLYYNTTGGVRFEIGDINSVGTILSTNNYLTTNAWYNIVVTRKGSTRTKIYINGSQSASNTDSRNPAYVTTYPAIGTAQYLQNNNTWFMSNGSKIDGLTIYNKELTESEITSLYNSGNGAEYPFSTQTLDSLNDAVGSNHGTRPASTLTGGVPGPTFTTGKIGKAFTFDGINDYIALPNNSLNSLTGDFSVSGWIYMPANTSNSYCVLLSNVSNDYTTGKGWNIFTYGNNIYFDVWYSGVYQSPNSAYVRLQVSNVLTNNAWNHVTITRKNSTSSKIYINGSLVGSNTSSQNPATPTAAITPTIGVLSSVGVGNPQSSYAPNGTKIDAVSVWNRELSTDEITALYNSGNGQQYPFSNITLSNSILDSVNAQNGTNVNNVTFTTGKVGNAFTFNGSNYISLPDNSLNSLTGDFSISCWYYLKQTNDQALIANRQISGGNNYGWQLYYHSGWLYFYIFNGTSTTSGTGFELGIANDTWVHITLVRKAGTSTKFYINGVLRPSSVIGTVTTNPVYTTNQKCSIGNVWNGTYLDSYVKNGGKIDGLTIWNKELTETEITSLYNEGTGAEYPFSTQTLPSLKDSVGTNDGTRPSSTLTGGVPGPSFTTGKIGKAFNFDGINDIVALPDDSLNFTGSFSYSFWSKSNDTTNYGVVVGNVQSPRSGYGYFHGYEISFDLGKYLFFFRSGNNTQYNHYTTNVVNNGNWNHIVVTYNPNNLTTGAKIYVNGTLNIQAATLGLVYPIGYSSPMKACIGARNHSGTPVNFLPNGTSIDALSSWNKELTETEVTELYNSGNGKQYPY